MALAGNLIVKDKNTPVCKTLQVFYAAFFNLLGCCRNWQKLGIFSFASVYQFVQTCQDFFLLHFAFKNRYCPSSGRCKLSYTERLASSTKRKSKEWLSTWFIIIISNIWWFGYRYSPFSHIKNYRQDWFAKIRQFIFNLWRHYRIYMSFDNSIMFQFTCCLCKHFVGNTVQWSH